MLNPDYTPTLVFIFVVLVIGAVWDAAAIWLKWWPSISETIRVAYVRWPPLPWVLAALAVLLWYHLFSRR